MMAAITRIIIHTAVQNSQPSTLLPINEIHDISEELEGAEILTVIKAYQ